MMTTRASGGSIRQQVSSAAAEDVAVGRQGDRDPRPLQAARGQDVDPERLGVDLGDQQLGRQVGEPDADDIAVGLLGGVEDRQAGDDGPGEVGHRLDHQSADHVGVHPRPRVVLAHLADDQDVDLVEREPAHQALARSRSLGSASRIPRARAGRSRRACPRRSRGSPAPARTSCWRPGTSSRLAGPGSSPAGPACGSGWRRRACPGR